MRARFLWAVALAGLAAIPLHSAASPSAALATEPQSVVADVNDFHFASFDAVYTLGRDDEGRARLHTVERLVAVFPDFDQNRGIIRNIPHSYDGHPTDLQIVSVKDAAGLPRDFTTESGSEYLSVTIAVPRGQFVHGAQTYVIEYTQRDVTQHFADTSADEFYWDVNGTGWRQSFDRVSARIVLEGDLAASLNGDQSCYRGRFGSTDTCAIARSGSIFTIDEESLWSYQNVTFAIGFASGTFAPRPFALFEAIPPLIFGGWASIVGALGIGIGGLTLGRRGARTGDAIIAQFEPPPGVDASFSALLMGEPRRAMTATLLDLAVRRHIQLLYDREGRRFGARVTDRGGYLSSRERLALTAVETTTNSNGTAWFGGSSTALGDAAATIRTSATREIEKGAFLTGLPKWVTLGFALLSCGSIVFFVVQAITTGDDQLLAVALAVGLNVLVWVLFGFFMLAKSVKRRTLKGAKLHDHLLGLREFIRLADADRIRMLQSVSGVQVDKDYIVHVYERMLPYAAIFGLEREWQAELSRYYTTSSPEWFSGSGTFDHTSFTALHTTVASSPVTYVPSSSSDSGSSFSSSGGSSGGGSSGGGGGGGGGSGI